MRNGRRCSSAVAYLNPARSRDNLTILTKCAAKRITFDGKRATGVKVFYKGAERTITARKELILSAGAIASPQLLMVSGIGEADELKSHGIEVRADLPGVGKNLQDHLQIRRGSQALTRSAETPESSSMSSNLSWHGQRLPLPGYIRRVRSSI